MIGDSPSVLCPQHTHSSEHLEESGAAPEETDDPETPMCLFWELVHPTRENHDLHPTRGSMMAKCTGLQPGHLSHLPVERPSGLPHKGPWPCLVLCDVRGEITEAHDPEGQRGGPGEESEKARGMSWSPKQRQVAGDFVTRW